jgi:hypothetical protein
MSNLFARQIKKLKFIIKIKTKKEMIEGFFTYRTLQVRPKQPIFSQDRFSRHCEIVGS